MKRSHLAREIVETVALTLLIFLVIRFVVQSYHVEGSSMETNLTTDNFVLVNKVAYLFRTPERGDVIVFHYPLDTTRDFIKRVIGLPGDVIKIDMTHVWVNGVLLKEPYVHQSINQSGSTWTVPANSYFVMGDNRPVSDDLRDWGFVPKDYVVGKAVVVYWPIKTWEVINTFPQVYAQIKLATKGLHSMQDSEKQQPTRQPKHANGHDLFNDQTIQQSSKNHDRRTTARRSDPDTQARFETDERTGAGALPARRLSYTLIAGVAAGILSVLLNIALVFLNTSTFQTAAREGKNIAYNTALTLVGLQCLNFFTTILICFAAGFLVAKLIVDRRMGSSAGAVAGAIAYIASFLTRYIPNYPGNIAGSNSSNGGAVIGAIVVALLFLIIQGLIGGLAGFLGARTATRKHPYYAVHEE